MPQRNNARKVSKEADLQLAVQALGRDASLTVPRAAVIYKVSESTLRRQRDGGLSRRDWRPKSMRLEATEEWVIVQHILKLDEQGYPPRLSDVEDMANSLLAERNQPPIGKNWAGTFVKRQPELTVKFNRKYD